ncbi:TonB-dependent receptor [Thermomonas carbonis]|uniref:TonB-dependent receptor n=1 Tax=Thermomonas carbonis TaxID=1463158 RepID=A0A7G9SLR5_9GAMM|nr:TonB-dependent receptor [Thermomonas carbonis]
MVPSLLACTATASGQDRAELGDQAKTLDAVVVTARLDRVPAFEVPASITTVEIEGRSGFNLGLPKQLGRVAGVSARDRQNFAQDMQLSIRGFGARATFGVRGIRLYADGIPATMPDGQGQVSHFSLLGGGSIEVLRGPFSALHGNSSGGVVQWRSAEPTPEPELLVQSSIGRDDYHALGARLRGTTGSNGYNIAVQGFETQGYRDHSAARRTQLHGKVGFDLGAGGTLDVVASRLDAPNALDPLGLTRAQVSEDPTQATAAAHAFNTRKSVMHQQMGVLHTLALGPGTLRTTTSAGERQVEQVLAVPVAAQANPLSAGGVIALADRFSGMDARWSWQGTLAGRAAEMTLGISVERQRQHRRGFENFDGATLGVRGALRRDERGQVLAVDQYAQAWWHVASKWSILLGARHSTVRFQASDQYVTAANPDDSGRVRYSQTTPVAGLVYAPGENLRLYLSAGRGFETPTFNELGYRADGGAGLALDLRPAVSHNLEVGGKWRHASGARIEAALFRTDTSDEVAVASNVGGRSTYRNVGASRRAGVELMLDVPVSQRWTLQGTYTGLDARFRTAFPICAAAGCQQPGVLVAAGTRIPGVARQQLQASAQWRSGAWWATIEGSAVGEVSVNDQGDERAPGYALANLAAGWRSRLANQRVDTFVRIENLLDRAHIGSVIVNEGNRRYYEPGAGRGIQIGVRWTWDAPPSP